MKKGIVAVIAVSVLLIAGGIVGSLVTGNNYTVDDEDIDYYYGRGMMYGYYDSDDEDDSDTGEIYYYGHGMMSGYYYDDEEYDGEKLSDDELNTIVEEYLDEYYDGLSIGDVTTTDSGYYYYVIVDAESSEEVTVLSVNPYTGYIYHSGGVGGIYCLDCDDEYYSYRGGIMGHGNRWYIN